MPGPPAALGVDFGTSHTVAMLDRGAGGTGPLLFDGTPLLPSAVFAEPTGDLVTGRDALHSARMEPSRFEPNPKRRIDDGSVLLGGRELPVVELFAAVLKRCRDECERVTGGIPASLTLTHPAEWGPTRRLVLDDAARAAGFGQPHLMPEPVAAARYFARVLRHTVPAGSAVVVYDFGGGTFDASVVVGTETGFDVRAVEGLNDLGGVDLDETVVAHLAKRFDGDANWTRLMQPSTVDERRQRRLFYDDARMAKERLSRHNRADLAVPVLNVDTHLTREELETLTRPLLQRAVHVTEAVIRAARVSVDGIAGVFLVGGASRMPLAATTLHQATGIAPTVIDQPELVVAHGAVTADPASPDPSGPPGQAAVSPPGQPAAGPLGQSPAGLPGQPSSAADGLVTPNGFPPAVGPVPGQRLGPPPAGQYSPGTPAHYPPPPGPGYPAQQAVPQYPRSRPNDSGPSGKLTTLRVWMAVQVLSGILIVLLPDWLYIADSYGWILASTHLPMTVIAVLLTVACLIVLRRRHTAIRRLVVA
ncbi:MAG: Hsp70 family protein, partial [Stackebrandtia sp.]